MIRFLQKDNRVIKAVFITIISVACITMVITLVPGIFQNEVASTGTYATIRPANPLMRVFGSSQEIQTADVQMMASRMLQRQQLPEFVLPYMMQRVGQGMIQQQVELVEADRLGLKVSNDAVVKFLHTGQFGMVLFPKGQYIGDQAYAQLINDNFGISRERFEAEIKKEIEENRLRDLVTGGVSVSDAEVRSSFIDQATKIKFDYAVVSADDLRKTINPSDAELQTFFKQNAARYATAVPETRKIEYIAFSGNSAPGSITPPTDAEMQSYYQQHTKDFTVEESAKVRHILIKVDPNGGLSDEAAKAKAQGILDQLHKGGDFAALAKANSDDPGSKAQGGELPPLKRGQTVPEFDQAAFSLPIGQLSGLIKTRFGYHILQVEERQTAHTRPFDEVKTQILSLLTQQKEAAQQQQYAQSIAAEAQKTGLQKTAEAHHLQVQTTDYVGQDGVIGGLADGSKVLTAAFGAKKGAAPQMASTGDGFAVFQVEDVKAAHAPDFATYKDHILGDYREQQTPALLAKKTAELADKARSENDLAKAAKEVGATFKSSDLVGRTAQVPDVGALATAAPQLFTLNVGQISAPINTARSGVVAKLTDKQPPTADEIQKNLSATRETILNQRKEDTFAVFVTTLTETYKKAGRIVMNKGAQAPAGGLPGGGPVQPGS
jgi:peptidyl-prolyl cis-trans isomerase D